MSTASGIQRLGGAFVALAAAVFCTVLTAPAAHAAGFGWGLGLGTNGVTVSPQASINIFGGAPNDRRGYYEPAPARAIVIVPARPHYRDSDDDRYWEDEAAPPPRPHHGHGAKRGHGHGHRHHHRHNGRDYYRY